MTTALTCHLLLVVLLHAQVTGHVTSGSLTDAVSCLPDRYSLHGRLRAMCPFEQRMQRFGDDQLQLLIASCLCNNASCAAGMECTAVKVPVTYRMSGELVTDLVPVACVCAARSPRHHQLAGRVAPYIWQAQRSYVDNPNVRKRQRRHLLTRRRY